MLLVISKPEIPQLWPPEISGSLVSVSIASFLDDDFRF